MEELHSIMEFVDQDPRRPIVRYGPGTAMLERHSELQICRRKIDVLPDLLPKQVIGLSVPLPPQQAAYDRADRGGVIQLKAKGPVNGRCARSEGPRSSSGSDAYAEGTLFASDPCTRRSQHSAGPGPLVHWAGPYVGAERGLFVVKRLFWISSQRCRALPSGAGWRGVVVWERLVRRAGVGGLSRPRWR